MYKLDDSTKDVATIKTVIQGRRLVKTEIQYSKPGVATVKIQ